MFSLYFCQQLSASFVTTLLSNHCSLLEFTWLYATIYDLQIHYKMIICGTETEIGKYFIILVYIAKYLSKDRIFHKNKIHKLISLWKRE